MKCRRCRTDLTARQVYRGNRFCSVLCANRGPKSGGSACGRPREWECVLALLGASGEWWITLSDLAIWRYGDDSEYDVRAVRESLCRVRREGYAIEYRDLPSPYPGRRSIRGYRLAKARKEAVA